LISRSFLFEGLELAGPSHRCRHQSTCEPTPAERDDVPRGFADDAELSTQSGMWHRKHATSQSTGRPDDAPWPRTRGASAAIETDAGEIVVAGLEVTKSLIDRWTYRSDPWRVFGDRVGRMQKVRRVQKRDEPIKLDTEVFAQVLLVSGEKTPWALFGIFELQHRFLPEASSPTGCASDKTGPRDQARLRQLAAFAWGQDSRPSSFIPDAQKEIFGPVVARPQAQGSRGGEFPAHRE
jgi:hypothetical protein